MAIGIAPSAELLTPGPAVDSVPPEAPAVEEVAPVFGVVFFGFDSATIRSTDVPVLEANLSALLANPTVQVLVEGHCDERGSEAYNLALGERRAEAVKRWLVARGVAESRIVTVSRGESAPTNAGHHEAAWAENRRATTVTVSAPNS